MCAVVGVGFVHCVWQQGIWSHSLVPQNHLGNEATAATACVSEYILYMACVHHWSMQ